MRTVHFRTACQIMGHLQRLGQRGTLTIQDHQTNDWSAMHQLNLFSWWWRSNFYRKICLCKHSTTLYRFCVHYCFMEVILDIFFIFSTYNNRRVTKNIKIAWPFKSLGSVRFLCSPRLHLFSLTQQLVESMPWRIKAVLKAKGGPTRY